MTTNPEDLKSRALAFYDALIVRRDIDEALSYVGEPYIQHNPMLPDGTDGLRFVADMFRREYPLAQSTVKQAFVDGDYVILHVLSRRSPEGPERAIVDIFRFEDGLIREHWDVIQEVPANPVNTNGMF
ncbi:MAG TPA: ester cyclase [Pseudolysinimonas sp.]|nr:ester cyclase [Pseudolysinimonas sp.]